MVNQRNGRNGEEESPLESAEDIIRTLRIHGAFRVLERGVIGNLVSAQESLARGDIEETINSLTVAHEWLGQNRTIIADMPTNIQHEYFESRAYKDALDRLDSFHTTLANHCACTMPESRFGRNGHLGGLNARNH